MNNFWLVAALSTLWLLFSFAMVTLAKPDACPTVAACPPGSSCCANTCTDEPICRGTCCETGVCADSCPKVENGVTKECTELGMDAVLPGCPLDPVNPGLTGGLLQIACYLNRRGTHLGSAKTKFNSMEMILTIPDVAIREFKYSEADNRYLIPIRSCPVDQQFPPYSIFFSPTELDWDIQLTRQMAQHAPRFT